MALHLQRSLEELNKKILVLGTVVEESVRKAVQAIEHRDSEIAHAVIDGDNEIDQLEVELEEECLKILALYQPVAADLRFIVATLKINNDLERVGDLAVNISERAIYLATQKPVNAVLNFHLMATRAQTMLAKSLDALVRVDPVLARQVLASDDEVDAMNREMYIQIQNGIRKFPEEIEPLIHLLSVSRHLERIADLATNIAEDVIYLAEAQIVRHQAEAYPPSTETDRRMRFLAPGE
jgi:phosphate transport system protein